MDIPELNISVTKAAINGQVVDVISREEYFKNPDFYKNGSYAVKSLNNDQILLPIKGEYSDNCNLPGVYSIGNVAVIDILPEEAFTQRYIPDKYISMSNNDNIKELIKSGDAIKKLDEPFITSPDNITNIPIRDDDQPEMKGLKMALNAKNIDIDKYAGRFKENFPNDKRQLKNNNATLKIIKRFCENCDMDAILTFKDRSPDVPNPMNREISISLINNDDIIIDEQETELTEEYDEE